MEKVADWVKSKIVGEGMCESSTCALKEFDELATELTATVGECESGAWVTVLSRFLEVVLPLVVEWLNRKGEDE